MYPELRQSSSCLLPYCLLPYCLRSHNWMLMYYDLGHVHSNLGEFHYRFLMQKFRFSVPASSARLLSSNVILCDQYLLYVFMYSWVYNGAPQPCFSRCMVDCTLMTDQMTTIFVFHFIWGHYQEAEFATNIQTGKDL